MDARRKLGEHEKCGRVARGTAESNSGFLSALQTSQVHPKFDIRTPKSMSKFFHKNQSDNKDLREEAFIVIDYNCHCFGFGQFPINNCVLYSPG